LPAAGSVADALNVNDVESQSVVSSSYTESDFLLIASLQLGALKTLGVLLRSTRYTELLLMPRECSDGEKRLSSGTAQDDLQVEMSLSS